MRFTLKALVLLTLLSFVATLALGQAESGQIAERCATPLERLSKVLQFLSGTLLRALFDRL